MGVFVSSPRLVGVGVRGSHRRASAVGFFFPACKKKACKKCRYVVASYVLSVVRRYEVYTLYIYITCMWKGLDVKRGLDRRVSDVRSVVCPFFAEVDKLVHVFVGRIMR